MSTLESNKDVVRGLFAALTERRLGDLPAYLAADVVDHNKIIYGEEDAPGAAFEGFRQQLDAFEEGGMVPTALVAEGDKVVAMVQVSGRHTGAHPRMPEPTGRWCSVEQMWMFTVTAGRITDIRAVSDRLGMFLQLGWDWPAA
jgi:ketosteroid isomerase-like protein